MGKWSGDRFHISLTAVSHKCQSEYERMFDSGARQSVQDYSGWGQKMNIYDIDSLNVFADARRERFLDEARQNRISRELGVDRQRVPGRFRRAIGLRLISAGSRLSGINSGDVRRASTAA